MGRHPLGPRRAALARRGAGPPQRAPGDGPRRHGVTHRRAAGLDGDPHRARLAPDRELPVRAVPPHRPQRGVGAPALRRAGPRPDTAEGGADHGHHPDPRPVARRGHRMGRVARRSSRAATAPYRSPSPPKATGRPPPPSTTSVAAVLAAVDAAPDQVMVVGHSAASTLAWLAADARPDKVARVVFIGGWPNPDGSSTPTSSRCRTASCRSPAGDRSRGRTLPTSMRRPSALRGRCDRGARGGGPGRRTADGRATLRRAGAAGVSRVHARPGEGVGRGGDLPELAKAKHLEYVDIDSGHWPMFTKPAELAALLAAAGDA